MLGPAAWKATGRKHRGQAPRNAAFGPRSATRNPLAARPRCFRPAALSCPAVAKVGQSNRLRSLVPSRAGLGPGSVLVAMPADEAPGPGRGGGPAARAAAAGPVLATRRAACVPCPSQQSRDGCRWRVMATIPERELPFSPPEAFQVNSRRTRNPGTATGRLGHGKAGAAGKAESGLGVWGVGRKGPQWGGHGHGPREPPTQWLLHALSGWGRPTSSTRQHS